mgnify:CR=1 FL=1
MKVLLINGSPKVNGNTAFALSQMEEVFHASGVETETIQVGSQLLRGCIGCASCYKTGKCVFDDLVNETAAKLPEYDGIVVGSPVYYASPNGTLLSFLDRLFYSTGKIDKRMKVGASVVVARRGGCTAAMDVLNKYFTISGMPVASSTYWNQIHGAKPGEAGFVHAHLRCGAGVIRLIPAIVNTVPQPGSLPNIPIQIADGLAHSCAAFPWITSASFFIKPRSFGSISGFLAATFIR